MIISVRWKSLLPRVAIAGVCAGSFFKWVQLEPQQLYSAAGVIAGVCATLLGFLIAAIALITALMTNTLISNMKKTGHYKVLMSDTFMTCWLLLLSLAISTASLLIGPPALKFIFTSTIFVFSLGLLYVLEAGRRFAIVIHSL